MAYGPVTPLEICFSFDTTRSMTEYVDQVKGRLQDMVQKLQADVPNIRIALMAHGDFYHKEYKNTNPYVLKHVDFTDDVTKLCKFIQSASPTFGGSWEECYEYVLKRAGEVLSWSDGTNKVFVLIGDAIPHEVDTVENKYKLDWKVEAAKLRTKGVKLYGTYCKTENSEQEDEDFFKDLAARGDGQFLRLENFSSILDFLMAICYREHGEDALQTYEAEVKGREKSTAKDVAVMFKTLKKSASKSAPANKRASHKVAASRAGTAAAPTLGKPKVPQKSLKTTTKGKTPVNPANITPRKPLPRPGATKLIPVTFNKMPGKYSQIGTTATGSAKRRSRSIKNTKKGVAKLLRENVPQTNFLLRELQWSPWKLIYAPDCLGRNWTKRPGDKIGYWNKTLLRNLSGKKSIFEFGVQVERKKRLVVVLSKTGSSLLTTRSKRLEKQIDKVLKGGCLVFIRRLILKHRKSHMTAHDALKLYDYAWSTGGRRNGKTRDLVKDGVSISEQTD